MPEAREAHTAVTPSEATALLATLKAAYPRQPIEQATIVVYAADLADLDADRALQAVTNLRRTSRWFPTIAEIREEYAELTLGAPAPELAWELARTSGCAHPLVNRAQAIVGDQWDWRRGETTDLHRRFIAAYKDVRAEAIQELAAPELQRVEVLELER